MDICDIISLMSHHQLFKNIDTNKLSLYLKDEDIVLRKFLASEVVISPNSNVIPVGVILSGSVEITSASENHRVLLKTAGKGSVFGIANLYAKEASFPSIIKAKSDTEIIMISPEAFRFMLESESEIMKNFLGFLSKKIMYLNKKISSYTAGSSECRLAYFLCDNEIDGVVNVNLSYSDIAVMLDMGRASLYRAFDKLENEKILERNGHTIRIIDKEKIKKYI